VEFGILGPLQVVGANGPVVLRGAKRGGLLAYLVVHAGEAVSLDRLVDDLWDGRPSSGARGTVQSYLTGLRKLLAGEDDVQLERGPSGYVLSVPADCVDAARFERLCAEAVTEADAAKRVEILDAALAMSRGAPLVEFAGSGWADVEATRLETLRLQALQQRVDACLALGRHGEVIPELQRLVRDHRLDERFWAQLMLAYYRAGRQADALRAYQQVRSILAEELGVDPGVELAALERQVLGHDPALVLAGYESIAELPLPPRLRVEGVFVGREDERARLDAAFEAVRAGEGRHAVLVAGEPGIGKTTLAARFARAHVGSAVVLYGHCDEGLGIPYQPWAEGLTHLVRHLPEGLLDAHVAARGGELRRLVPVLAERVDAPEPASSDPEADRYLLFAAVVDLLARAASDVPVVLVLEDLHWADLPTVQLLRYVAGAEASQQLLVVATYRDSDVSEDHPLAATLAALHRESGVERITLDGLRPDALGALLEATGHALDADDMALRDALVAETDGNPFFVIEVLRDLSESGDIGVGEDLTAAQREAVLHVPESVREVIVQRAARLGDDSRRLLTAASVIGRDFDMDLVAAVGELDALTALDAIDAASTAALVQPAPGGADRYTFVHALIAHALLDTLSPARRHQMHARVAESLEAACGEDPGERIGELARHWLAAGPSAPPEKVFGYAIAAGDAAQQRLAPDEAVRWYTHALELIDHLDPATRDEQRCAVLLHLGTAQRLAGRPDFGQTLLDAARLAQRLGDTDRLVAAALANTRGFTAHMGWVDDERLAVLRAALDAIGTSAPGLRARLLAQWAIETMLSPDYDNQALIAEALTLTETGDDPNARLRALSALCSKAIPHNLEQRRACQAELLELASQLDPAQQWSAFSACCVQAVQAGEFFEAQRFLDDMRRTAQASGDPALRWMSETYAAALGAFHGDDLAAEQHASTALRLGIEAAQPDAHLVNAALLLSIRTVQGREAELCEWTAQMAAEYPGISSVRGALAWMLAAGNRNDEARAILDDLVAELPSVWVDRVWAPTLALCTGAAALIGHTATARSVVPLLAPFADQWIFNGGNSDGPVALVLAVARTALADYERADADFAQALAMAEHADSLYWTARAQLEWAIMLCQRDHSDDQRRASLLLRDALHTAAAHDYAGIERRGSSCQIHHWYGGVWG
jgi:DNA-binding SARP family transcriptional activator